MKEGRQCEDVFVGGEDSLFGSDDEGNDGSSEVTDNSLALSTKATREGWQLMPGKENSLVTRRFSYRRLASARTFFVTILRDRTVPK